MTTRRTVLFAGSAAAATAALGVGLGRSHSAAESPAPAAGTVLAAPGDVPVGGGQVTPEPAVVVTQPSPGEFRAFSALCTHRGCTVAGVVDGAIQCPCHGSRFDLSDGSVLAGPATEPLPAVEVTVADDAIRLA